MSRSSFLKVEHGPSLDKSSIAPRLVSESTPNKFDPAMKTALLLAAAIAGVMHTAPRVVANVIRNAGFEEPAGSGGVTPAWEELRVKTETNAIVPAGGAHTGLQSLLLGPDGEATQVLDLGGGAFVLAEAGSVISISGWMSNANFTPGVRVQVNLGVVLDPAPDNSSSTPSLFTWAPLTLDEEPSVPDGVAWAPWSVIFTVPDAATLVSRYGVGADQALDKPIFVSISTSDEIQLDDLSAEVASVASVPEPSATALAAGAGLLLARRRRPKTEPCHPA
jgi:hypothetical protein